MTFLYARPKSSKMRDVLLQEVAEMKKKVEGNFCRGNEIVQSRDQANLFMDLVQSITVARSFASM